MTQDAWTIVSQHHNRLRDASLTDLFAQDPDRFQVLSRSLDDLTVDFSKERLDAEALDALLSLCSAAGVENRRAEMFAGAHINITENRAVMHAALRATADDGLSVDGTPTAEIIDPVLDTFLSFADDVRRGAVLSAGGSRFTDVVNIGIGGSDLGPVMVARALSPYRGQGPRTHFVSNVDGAHLRDVTSGLDPKTTLVIVASKTFTTQETMANATAARAWLVDGIGEGNAGLHLAALSTNLEATAQFGIQRDRVFGFWDWVGGRYSVWSAIGLSVALSVGGAEFRSFLEGARSMDQHFQTAPANQNLPILLALIGIWRRNFMGCPTVALIPYDQRLERFPAYVQQLDMESNGKQTTLDGQSVSYATGPVIWGEPGTNAQHSFFQLIHQGTDVIPVDFIVAAQSGSDLEEQHTALLANCLAQSEALAFGKSGDEVRSEMATKGHAEDEIERLVPHRTFPGNRPSTTILHKRLDAFTLGRLIALFEHKVFVQGAVWGINSYDQWGVELGKVLAQQLIPIVGGAKDASEKDSSTAGLVARIAELRG